MGCAADGLSQPGRGRLPRLFSPPSLALTLPLAPSLTKSGCFHLLKYLPHPLS